MGIFLEQSEADERIELSDVLFKRVHDKTRPEGAKEIPFDQRVAIGTLAKSFDNNKVVAEVMNVSGATVSNYKQGKVASHKDTELSQAIDKRLGIVRDKALDVLIDSLDAIDTEKLNTMGPLVASKVASNIAGIIEKTAEKVDQTQNLNVIVYTPRLSKLDDYATVVLPETK